MRKLRAFLLSLAVAGSAVTPASAQVLGDPEVIRILMQDQGLPVEAAVDATGDPVLRSRIDLTEFQVFFYDCTPVCAALQFSAGFDLPRPMTLARANQWNRDRRFGKVYLDETGDPFVEMDVILSGDGIGRKNFNEALDTWRAVLSEFRDFIDW
ncbi:MULTISPECIES: YbjN domain-containing protein [unclassified Paracoccus (in: a-proteobacteria)]|uniref:YbjN domain-containing protein n=1 Tax=unclassified Paracoccus (in: a-proteobacteria) TaxID=2688777 RepID=UPI0012B2E4B1|nr:MULTISPECIES: YbjN domain-containing protein [unclassified Paracoccus (in: a-proteobacteria)]UXU75808.1 YbjN domain-containing protein [Paracoccus sp. SMMA_5]UXU81717.1 YbjN domain-containing protein [Paracoccus sp. SMMA_5_TC]